MTSRDAGSVMDVQGRTPRSPQACTSFDSMRRRAAAAECTLLLTGETGVGKGHLARWIHDHSARAGKPFVAVNCGALPETLIDSQLFGHERGAFTGAAHSHPGFIRTAEGGTLLLDEVGELPAAVQVRLLRVLEEREVQPVGCAKPVHVNVRIIAATNDDLHAAVETGRFRTDLLYRLDVVRLELPPLRERREQIMPLLEQFNLEFAVQYQRAPLTFDEAALETLHRCDWPGNIRELRTVIERLHILCGDDHVTFDHLLCEGQLRRRSRMISAPSAELKPEPWSADDDAWPSGSAAAPLNRQLRTARADVIRAALAACGGNVSRAAQRVGVHRSTLYRWLSESHAA